MAFRWINGEAFPQRRLAQPGEARFTTDWVNSHCAASLPKMLIVERQDQAGGSLIAKTVIDQGPANAAIHLSPRDFDTLAQPGEELSGIAIRFRAASFWTCINHPSKRATRNEAVVNFIVALVLAGCALAGAIYAIRADTPAAVLLVALIVCVVTIAGAAHRIYGDLRKLYG